MQNALVSIITPCYNAENTLPRYLESILGQTYKNIEVIAVDDGSNDNTAAILEHYSSVFQKANMKLRYVFQENCGLGGAINTGLKYASGDYLCWSDPDDFYMLNSIEKRLAFLEAHPEYAVVSSDALVYNCDDLVHPIRKESKGFRHCYEEHQFEYLLREESIFCAGCHMVRMKDFDSVNPEHEIYPAKRGQNWQLLLPLYYRYKRFFLDEPLYAYIIYPNSMSTADVTEKSLLVRYEEHEQIIINTLERMEMDISDKLRYTKQIRERYALKRFYAAIDFKDKKLLTYQYQILKNQRQLNKTIKQKYLRNKYMMLKIYYKIRDFIARRKCND